MYRTDTTGSKVQCCTIIPYSVSIQIQHSLYSQSVSFRYNQLKKEPNVYNNTLVRLYQSKCNNLCILSVYRLDTTRSRAQCSTIIPQSVSIQIQHSLYSQFVSFRYNTLQSLMFYNNTLVCNNPSTTLCILSVYRMQIQLALELNVLQ